jgi:putative ABC transport system substrate-binding protein
MRRRELITFLGGAAAWPLSARGQQGERMRRIGVYMSTTADDSEGQARNAAFLQGLQEFGWTVGKNVRIEYRWGGGKIDRNRVDAAELIDFMPDVILANGATFMGPLQQATRTIPIVFVGVTDPVGSGFVASLAKPGGNTTGFTQYEFGVRAKWLELLNEIAPSLKRVAVLRDPNTTSGVGQFAAMQAVAPSLGLELSPIDVRDAAEIERAVTAFARGSKGGLIVASSPFATGHRKLIIALAAQHHLPAIYPFRYHVADGGLISYGPDTIEPYRRAAGYVDRILKGEIPADLPVQAPTKYELVINLKTAKALGLDIPASVFARANEVIE